jgi:hypothetical protein
VNGKKAKRLRREVREALGMGTIRVDGINIHKIGNDDYQVHQHTGQVRCNPTSSRVVYQRYKKLTREYNERG